MPFKTTLALLLIVTLNAQAQTDVVDGAWYDASLPVPVLHLEGSIEEVAREHGAMLARHPKAKETLLYLGGLVDRRLTRFHAITDWAYRHFIRGPMIDHVPLRYRSAYELFAKASGVPLETVWNALVLPDAALRAISLFYNTEVQPILPGSFGCTSVIWNAGTSSALHGRNLDYDGVGYWDRNQVILHVVPQEGLAYVAVTALGVHAPGITAFNEAGLTLAVHQLTLDDTQAAGTPMPIISAEVIRDARTIDDAIAIVRSFPRAGGWAYVVSQGRDRAVIEASANEIAIRRSSEPFFFQTNHVSSPALAKHQVFYSPGSWLDSFQRAERLSKLVSSPKNAGWASPEQMAHLLNDYRAKPIVAGGTIAKLDNIQSVIMDAVHRRLWIAIGTDTQAPNENTYVEYRWSDLRSADVPEVTGAEISVVPQEKLGVLGAQLRQLLRQAANQRLDTNERARLLESYAKHVQEASVKTGVPPYGTWSGLFLHVWLELEMGDTSVLDHLMDTLSLALRDPALNLNSPGAAHERALGRLFKGRLLDLKDQRSEALYEYAVVKRTASFERLQRSAAQGLRQPFTWDQARALAIDWSGIDLYRY